MPLEKKVAYRQSLKMKYGTSFAPVKENVLEWKDYINMSLEYHLVFIESGSSIFGGVGRDSDVGTITVLLQDGIGGLYVKAEILSNGKYKSSEQRVIMTTSTQSSVSIPLFTQPIVIERIGPLPGLVKKDELADYREVLWQDYINNFFGNPHKGKKTLEIAKINFE
ncbi:feruloyl CoA ortho-hydroxylase 1-like protein [Trifolium pratense]|uniref:Feruloyl CoA ortho-hydroxylase 1-like protein n=1 Tax=Trifolium pratense TaxID=57577 RepID=A0A2K3MMH8_TRIPR|nr:feruloyl CoA ortho-hydroxylase 1-like protein [Trifolium pratense]